MYKYNINGKDVNLKVKPDIYSNETIARQALRHYVEHTWLVIVDNKVWAVIPADASRLEKIGCRMIIY